MGLCCKRIQRQEVIQQAVPENNRREWSRQKIQAICVGGCAAVGSLTGGIVAALIYDVYIRNYFQIPATSTETSKAETNGCIVGSILGTHAGNWLANRILGRHHLQ